MMIRLRSSRTMSEMVADHGWDTTDPQVRWHHGTAIEAAERDPDGYWEQDWPLTQPKRDGWQAEWSVERWAAYAALIRDELRSGSIDAVRHAADKVSAAGAALEAAQAHRDAAIRAALAAGERVADVVQVAGVKRAPGVPAARDAVTCESSMRTSRSSGASSRTWRPGSIRSRRSRRSPRPSTTRSSSWTRRATPAPGSPTTTAI